MATLTSKRPSKRDETKAQIMADLTNDKQPKKRLNVEIEAELYTRIKLKATEEGRSISAVTRDLLIEYLSN